MSTISEDCRPQSHLRQFGIDLGGTKTEVVVLNGQGETLLRERRPTPAPDYAAVLDNIVDLLRYAESQVGPALSLGVGAPGAPIPSTGLIKNANTTCLIGKPLQADLAQRLRIPIYIENDANCFTLSESVDGAARGAHSVFGVILGTGVGGGLYLRDGLIRGLHHISGEWGHNPLPWRVCSDKTMPTIVPGRQCYCGLTDCIETYLSGPGLSRTYEEMNAHNKPTNGAAIGAAIGAANGENGATADQIFQLAQSGDALALRVRDVYTSQLAASLATVINVIDPEVIVLGGGVSNVTGLCESVTAELNTYVFSDSVRTKIVRALHGDSSGVRGAAWLSQHAV